MAKGKSTFHQLGKIDGRKYYTMKGVEGIVSSSINEGMSNKVKNDPAYENTRRNNYEFGMATSTAGAITKAFSQKWRYLLIPFATAKIGKLLLAGAKLSDNLGWGDRVMAAQSLNMLLPTLMQKFVKNDIQDFSPIAVAVSTEDDESTITVSAEDINNAKAAAAGCDGVRVVLAVCEITPADGGYSVKGISPATCEVRELDSADVAFGNDLSLTGTYTSASPAGVKSIVLLPYRTIGDEKYIMQEFCSAKFAQ